MLDSNVPVHQLELDRWEPALTYCPLLKDPANYIPDTVDLNADQEARWVLIEHLSSLHFEQTRLVVSQIVRLFCCREYWLKCFEEKIDTFVICAIASQPNNDTAIERANMFKEKYIKRLHHLKVQPL